VQHRLRPTPAQDLEALVIASVTAGSAGTDLVVAPEVPDLLDGPLGDELIRRMAEDAPGTRVVVARPEFCGGTSFGLEDGPFGRLVVLTGDACINAEMLESAAATGPGLAILAPGSESELQAQAILELAVALSTSLASVVIVIETDGAEVGEPGHGGSVIVHLGQVLAEAMAGDDLLIVDIPTPLHPPEAPEPLPVIPPVLSQRLAAHQGRKVNVDYPADLD